jgi:acyl-CoA hydrolase
MTQELTKDTLDLRQWIRPGDGVFWSQACSEPVGLVDGLIEQSSELGVAGVYCGHTLRDTLADPRAAHLRVTSHGTLGRLGHVARKRDVHIVPTHYSEIPGLFRRRTVPGDVALVQLAPPDRFGRCSFGMDAGYVADAVRYARVVVAEINEQMPPVAGDGMALADLDVVVRTNRPVLTVALPPPTEADESIAEHVAALVRDGDTIQVGVGGIPDAVLRRLHHLRDLAVHSGIVSDSMIDLVEAGVITGARKPIDHGRVVAGSALGSQRLVDFLATSHVVDMRAVSYTHRQDVLAQVGRLVAINGAIEVDLTGQVNSEVVNGRWLGAVGGQVDFLRGARAAGGVGIVALPSLAARSGDSRIVSRLSGPVTTARSDVDVVVTEYGTALLSGRDLAQRARALIAIADPRHRDELTRAASVEGLLAGAWPGRPGDGLGATNPTGSTHGVETEADNDRWHAL